MQRRRRIRHDALRISEKAPIVHQTGSDVLVTGQKPGLAEPRHRNARDRPFGAQTCKEGKRIALVLAGYNVRTDDSGSHKRPGRNALSGLVSSVAGASVKCQLPG